MKYLKTYESSKSPFIYEVEKEFKIHKIQYGTNKGKTSFKFYNEEACTYSNTLSFLLGCFKILDTKFEHDPKIRRIEFGGDRYRKLMHGTASSIIKRLENVDFVKKEDKLKYGDKLQNILTYSKNLGDIMDGLKMLKDINKYNL